MFLGKISYSLMTFLQINVLSSVLNILLNLTYSVAWNG